MLVNGRDFSLFIKTAALEKNIPYAEETIREDFILLREQAPIEGQGLRGGIRKRGGVTGCVVTPLTLGTAPLLWYLAMGGAGLPVFVSETRNVYQHRLELLPMEDGAVFDLIQDRNGERRRFENCRVRGFELRFERGKALHMKLDVWGDNAPAVYPYTETPPLEGGEHFSGDCLTCRINGIAYNNIYGLTLAAKKHGGAVTELWIKRAMQEGPDLPGSIEELTIEARLLRDGYEYRSLGKFRITLEALALTADETAVDCADAVIGPLRYFAAGRVYAEVFTGTGESIV